MKPEDIVILELSSFQLMGMRVSPNISVITNMFPDHLNVHSSYEEYQNAKKEIYRHQNNEDILILNDDNEITNKFKNEILKEKIPLITKNIPKVIGIILSKIPGFKKIHIPNKNDRILVLIWKKKKIGLIVKLSIKLYTP